jgi:hypothetical protein
MPAAIADALIDGCTHLLVLPGAKAAGTHKDGATFRFGRGLLDVWLPAIAWNQVPFVQPSLLFSLCELFGRTFCTLFGISARTPCLPITKLSRAAQIEHFLTRSSDWSQEFAASQITLDLRSRALADLFDKATPQPFFKGSKVPELE